MLHVPHLNFSLYLLMYFYNKKDIIINIQKNTFEVKLYIDIVFVNIKIYYFVSYIKLTLCEENTNKPCHIYFIFLLMNSKMYM